MDPEAMKSLLEFGVLGVIAIFAIGYVWWNTKNTARALREKDAYIKELNDRREDAAGKFQATVDALSTQLSQLLNVIDRRAEDRRADA